MRETARPSQDGERQRREAKLRESGGMLPRENF